MDIELKITPRLIERAVFIVAIAALLVSNLYFYNKSTASPQEKSEGLLAEGPQGIACLLQRNHWRRRELCGALDGCLDARRRQRRAF